MLKKAELYFAALLALAIAAFWPHYLGKPFANSDAYTHFHALVGFLWMSLLIAQPLAIRFQARGLHRALGKGSYILAPLFVVSGLLLAHYRLKAMDAPTFQAEAFSFYLAAHTAVLFALCYGLGIYYRRNAPAHARLMACTALVFVDPVMARLLWFYLPPLPGEWIYQGTSFVIMEAFVLAFILTYRGPAGGRNALIGVLAAFLTAHTLWFAFAPGETWFAFTSWFRGLPFT